VISGISGVGDEAFERGGEDGPGGQSPGKATNFTQCVLRAGLTPDLGRGGAWLTGKGVQGFQRGVAPEMGLSSERTVLLAKI
jgi:hypothetical protein